MMDTITDNYKELAAIYDEFIGVDKYEHAARKKNWLLVLLAIFGYKKEDGPFLDLGCGTGIQSLALAEEGYEVAGVDISESMLEVARKKAVEKGLSVPFIRQDITELELSRQFACIFSRETLTHIPDAQQLGQVFRRCASHLQPNGLLVFEICTAFALKLLCIRERIAYPRFIWEHQGVFGEEENRACIEYRFTFKDGTHSYVPVTFKAHTPVELNQALQESGFKEVRFFDSAIDPEIVNGRVYNVKVRPIASTSGPVLGGVRGIICSARKRMNSSPQ